MNKKVATIKIIDEVNVVIVGLRPSQYEFLRKKYGIYAKNYFFQKKYKLGQWDGKIYFFTKGGKTYFNLLPEIVPILKEDWGYKLKLIDQRQKKFLGLDEIDKNYFSDYGIELGDHQVGAVNAVIRHNSGIVLAGTGAGKSFMAAAISDLYIKNLGMKIIVIVPSSDLVSQTIDEFKIFDLDVGEYSGDNKDFNHDVVLSTWQALQNNPRVLSMFNMAIVDECHGVTGPVLKQLLNDAGAHMFIKIGLTGTIPDEEIDAMNVRVTLGEVIYTIESRELIDNGWLAYPEISILQLEEDFKDKYKEYIGSGEEPMTYKKFLESYFPDYNSEKDYLAKNEDRSDYISNLIINKRKKEKGNTLVLVNSRKVGFNLEKKIKNSIFIYGEDKKEFRRKIYSLFKTHNNIVVIATAHLASTGLNIPRIFYLFFVDLGKGYIRIIQSIGRGLRKAPDKDRVYIFDICSNLYYSNDHKNKRIKHYKKHRYDYTKAKIKYTKE